MASAISTLYGMGYTLIDDETNTSEMLEEDRGSDKSSPDTLRQRYAPAFDHATQLFGMSQSALPQLPPGPQYAAVLAGIGRNLTAVRALSTSMLSCHSWVLFAGRFFVFRHLLCSHLLHS